jgi:hypothetical protein
VAVGAEFGPAHVQRQAHEYCSRGNVRYGDRDVKTMRFAFDLGEYAAVRAHADAIYAQLASGDMPCVTVPGRPSVWRCSGSGWTPAISRDPRRGLIGARPFTRIDS